MADFKPADYLLKPLHIPPRLLAGAGPSNPSPRVQAACTLPLIIPTVPSQLEITQIMADIRAGIQYTFQTQTPHVFCVTGPGHGAMEAMCFNLLEPGDVFLVANNGFWGLRMKTIAERRDVDIRSITKDVGEIFSVDEIEKALQEHRPQVLFIVHGESMACTLQPVDQIGQLCHRYDCILLVDGVASIGAVPFNMDKWEIDAVYSGPQKVMNSLTGIAPVAFSTRACPQFHHTPSYTTIYALREAFSAIAEEGLEVSWRKHTDAAQLLYQGLEKLGLRLSVKDCKIRLPTVTGIEVSPDLLEISKDIVDYMATSLHVAISIDFRKPPKWRIGLMGCNATAETVEKILTALDAGLKWAKSRGQNVREAKLMSSSDRLNSEYLVPDRYALISQFIH
jgi:alanine-glyoxylate transaminase/serine-glyoxylate transaminase/serine-pyruvate transaminase